MPISWWSTPAPSWRRRAASRSTPSSPSPAPVATGPGSWSPAAWPSAAGGELAAAMPEIDAVARVRRLGGCHLGPQAARLPRRPSTCCTSRGHQRRPHGPTSRWPRDATGRAGSAPSPRSEARSGAGRSTTSAARSTAWWPVASRRSSSSPRTSPPTGRDQGVGERAIVPLVEAVAGVVPWVRLLYVYPIDLTDELERVLCEVAVPYVDLSLQHVSRPLVRRMRRWGDGDRFLQPDRLDPRCSSRRCLPFELHRRLPRRDRGRPRRAAALRRPRCDSIGAGSSPSARRTAPTPPASTARCRRP